MTNEEKVESIEEELGSYDFDEDTMHTRELMKAVLIKQRDCDHSYQRVYKGDYQTGIRCSSCGYQTFY